MQFMSFGGNQVKSVDLVPSKSLQQVNFATGGYHYYYVYLPSGTRYREETLQSFTVLCLSGDEGIMVDVADNTYHLKQGDAAQLENVQGVLTAGACEVMCLIAGTVKSHTNGKKVTITAAEDHKKIVKPWGHELWFNGEHPGYCLKEVMIKKGFRTSLQYHHFKEETNVLFTGNANLVYKEDATIANDDACTEDLRSCALSPISVVHVTPGVLHRLEAVTDVVLYETSTPYLDDVIRVQDDQSRHNGRIQLEHST